jgi:predicted transcriptional regulator
MARREKTCVEEDASPRMKESAIKRAEDVLVVECLQALGVELLSEWDTLVFLYRRTASLGTAAQIARLIGYDKTEVAAALHKLADLGLLRRSRDSQGIRLYEFSAPPEPGCRSCLTELMSLAQDRSGRLLLLKHLKRALNEHLGKRSSG